MRLLSEPHALPQGLLLRHCATHSRAAEILFTLCSDDREASSSPAVADALTALALTNNALSHMDAENLSEAEALLTQALELKPYGGLHRMFKNRSVAKLRMLDYSGALEDISRAISLAPNYYDPYICQGDVYVAQGQYDLAEKSYLKCLEIDPSLRRSKTLKARIANLQKKVVEVDGTGKYAGSGLCGFIKLENQDLAVSRTSNIEKCCDANTLKMS